MKCCIIHLVGILRFCLWTVISADGGTTPGSDHNANNRTTNTNTISKFDISLTELSETIIINSMSLETDIDNSMFPSIDGGWSQTMCPCYVFNTELYRGGTFLERGEVPLYIDATLSFNDIATTALNSPTHAVSTNDIDNFTGSRATSMNSFVKSVHSGGTSMYTGAKSMYTDASSSFGDLATSTKTIMATVNSLISPVSTNDIDNFTGPRVTSMYSGGTIIRSAVTSVHTDVLSSFSDTATSTQTAKTALNSPTHTVFTNGIDSFTKPRITSIHGASTIMHSGATSRYTGVTPTPSFSDTATSARTEMTASDSLTPPIPTNYIHNFTGPPATFTNSGDTTMRVSTNYIDSADTIDMGNTDQLRTQITESTSSGPDIFSYTANTSMMEMTSSSSDNFATSRSLVCHSVLIVDNMQTSQLVAEIIKNLTIDSKNISAKIRKKISVSDGRKSATTMGALGIGILVGMCAIIVTFDITGLLRHLKVL